MTTEARVVMVVDDDIDFLEWCRCVLEPAGYTALCFATANKAFEAMATTRPDLVATDLMMESLDSGFSFAERLKTDARFRDIPVIIVTAAESQRGFSFTPRTQEDLAAMKADAFFCKPIDPKKLVEKIRALLTPGKPAPGAEAGHGGL